MAGATQRIDIDVAPERFFSVITDYEGYPRFLADMESASVVSRDPGVEAVVRFTLDVIRRVTYTLRLVEHAPHRLEWTLVEGPFKSNIGHWQLEALPGGRTRATYQVDIQVGMFVPRSISNRLAGKTLPALLASFKKEAEARARAR